MTIADLNVVLDRDSTIILVDGPNSTKHNVLGSIPANSKLLEYLGSRSIYKITGVSPNTIEVFLCSE